jgi:hypothetical protein
MNNKHNREKNVNYAKQFAVVLFIAIVVNLLFYWLPDSILGIPVKKVDLLSDVRKDDIYNLLASDEDVEDIPFFSKTKHEDINPAVNVPDSFYFAKDSSNNQKTSYISENKDTVSGEKKINKYDISNKDLEDFSTGHTGLRRFFSSIYNMKKIGRPVRIAFLGDSFIEGDILVADFRAKMQERFGGRGVGFIPIESKVAQFRPTIKQSAEGWKTYSIINNKSKKYVLSGLLFETKSKKATVSFQNVDVYPGLKEVSTLKFLYSKNKETEISLRIEDEENTYKLPPTETLTQYEIKGSFTKGTLKFNDSEGLEALGLALEDNSGVVVDNFSLRGNSGMVMSGMDLQRCRDLQSIRHYDLIILQYGLNVASDSMREYGWYRKQMIAVVEHIRNCFPESDILLLGVSDRSHKSGGDYSTMPSVLSLLKVQRQTAEETGIVFWNIYAAMGGKNSMVQYVKSNWASKDYTHLSFKGGREIALALYEAIMREKNFYDDDE